jgi:hypothetical protein
MAVIQADQIDGLVKTTQRHIERERKASIAERLTKYVGVRNLFTKEKVMVSDGYGIEWNMTTDHSGTAQQVGLFDTIAPATTLNQVRFNLPWRHTRGHVSWDLREVAMNRSPARILNYVKEKIFEMDVSWFEQLEGQIWNGPLAGDDSSVMGIWGYWLYTPLDGGTSNATAPWTTTSTGGRVTVNPNWVTAGPGGVSRALYGSRHSHWYQNYGAVTYGDLFTKMRTGFDEIDFESPVDYSMLKDGATRFGIYCTQADARLAADACRLQNENIGTDLAYYDGKAMIRGVQITGVPKLNAIDAALVAANHPFMVIDWSQLRPFCLEGIAPYETTETGGANQPMTVTRAKYLTWNVRAWNTKTMGLFTQNTTTGRKDGGL